MTPLRSPSSHSYFRLRTSYFGRRFSGLRRRIVLTTVPLVLLATALLALSLLGVVRALYLEEIEKQILGQARLVGGAVAPQLDDPAALGPTVQQLGRQLGNRVTIIAPDGAVLADSEADAARMENHAGRPEVRRALEGQAGHGERESASTGRELLYVAEPIVLDGRIAGVARVARQLSEINAQTDRLGRIAFAAVLASGLLTALVALLLARYITEPLNHLTALAGQLAAGRLNLRSQPGANDEIGRLGRAFNRMADELQDTIALISDERGKLAAVLETMDDGLLMIDDTGAVVLANTAAEQLLGLPPGGITFGQPFVEAARDHELAALVRQGLRDRRPRTLTIEFGRPRRTLRATVTPVRGVGEPLALLVLHDLTELRRLETARRDFVANISHELRTPLASVKALVETLEDGAIEDEAVARRFLHQVSEEVDHLTQLVRELLELSRIESGQAPLQREAVAPADLILPTVGRLRAQAERAGLTLTVAPLEGLPAVLADPERIGQVLLNLLHNAVKFTPPGGAIEVSAEPRDSLLAVSVRDTGTGIEPDDLPRIFERFYKADKARSGGGTGLGLAIAKHTVTAHGGTLTVENNRGGPGATFTFTLPLAHAAQPGPRLIPA